MGGGRGGGWGRGGGGRGNGGHGDDDDARRALVRSVGAKKRAARRWLNWGRPPPESLRDYAPGGRYYDHLPPLVHHAAPPPPPPPPAPVVQAYDHIYAHDDAEEAALVAQAMAESEASIAEMLRRDDVEIRAQMALFRAREEAERASKRARMDGAGPSYAVDDGDDDSE